VTSLRGTARSAERISTMMMMIGRGRSGSSESRRLGQGPEATPGLR
jgi:hypothetical protein